MIAMPVAAQFLDVAFLAAFIAADTQVLLNVLQMPDAWQNRWAPIIVLVLGVVFAQIANAAINPLNVTTVANAALTGLMAGFSAMGVHNTVTKSVVGQALLSALSSLKPGPSAPAPEPAPLPAPVSPVPQPLWVGSAGTSEEAAQQGAPLDPVLAPALEPVTPDLTGAPNP